MQHKVVSEKAKAATKECIQRTAKTIFSFAKINLKTIIRFDNVSLLGDLEHFIVQRYLVHYELVMYQTNYSKLMR